MKRFIIFIMLLVVTLSCFGCKNKPKNNSSVPSDSDTVAQKEDNDAVFSDSDTAAEKEDDTVYPFAEISTDDIKEIFFGFQESHLVYACTKTYTDPDTIVKIIEFLKKTPMTGDEITESGTVGSCDPYVVELRNSEGETKYSLKFNGKFSQGYSCRFRVYEADGQSDDFYVDSDYLHDLTIHIETLDGREPESEYYNKFLDILDKDACSSVVLEYGDTVKEISGQTAKRYTIFMGQTRVRLPNDEDEEWNDDADLKKFTASFYDADKKLMCKFVSNGYLEDDWKYQLMFYEDDDTDGTMYVAHKKYFSNIIEDAKKGFKDIKWNY